MSDYEELGQMGFALAMQLLRDREDAADAVQDALQRLVSRRGAFDPARGSQRPWFLKIVRNRSLDLLRRRRVRDHQPLEPHALLARTERPDAIVEKREQLSLLKAELMELPAEQHELILLRDYHQLSYSEIADVLSVPMGTVMSRLHRARLALRTRMERHGGGQ